MTPTSVRFRLAMWYAAAMVVVLAIYAGCLLWFVNAGASRSLDNVIDVHIARLRRKLDADHPVKLIHTIRGVGFMLREGEPGE